MKGTVDSGMIVEGKGVLDREKYSCKDDGGSGKQVAERGEVCRRERKKVAVDRRKGRGKRPLDRGRSIEQGKKRWI